MGNRSAEVLKIFMLILAVIGIIVVGFLLFNVSKNMAFKNQSNLIIELEDVSESEYTSLNQAEVTGLKVKQIYESLKNSGSILILTKSFMGVQEGFNDNINKQESVFNGQANLDALSDKLPAITLEGYSIKTSGGNIVENPIAVNYGCILKNGISEVYDEDNINSNFELKNSKLYYEWNPYNDTVDYSQSIYFKDGMFYTKLEYASNLVNSKILCYQTSSDFNLKGKTMHIGDGDLYKSYIIKNIAGNYVGVVLVQE